MDYTKAIQVDPGSLYAYDGRCQAWMHEREFDHALSDCNYIIDNDPRPGSYYRRGELFEAMGRWNEAIADYSRAAGSEKVMVRQAALSRLTALTAQVNNAAAAQPRTEASHETADIGSVAEPPGRRRVALVIGNSAYVNVDRLANPGNDARLVAETLRALGFTLVGGGPQLDLTEAGLRGAVQEFGKELQGADVGLFYYAGHGVQLRGENYLVPVDANPTKPADVEFQMLDAGLVLRQMEDAGTKLNLIIMDACRNNPFGGRGLRSAVAGLAIMQAPAGTLISFATQPGNVAQDGRDGHSPYTDALVQTIRTPGLGLFDTFNRVGLAVRQATNGVQEPWFSSSPIAGQFYFAGSPANADRATP